MVKGIDYEKGIFRIKFVCIKLYKSWSYIKVEYEGKIIRNIRLVC